VTNVTTIVAAVDLSDTSGEVLRWAGVFAERFRAELAVVHVIHDLKSYTGFYLTTRPMDALQREIAVEAEEKLTWLAREHLGDGKSYKAVVLSGNPTQSLVRYLEESRADLLIVGCHGHAKPEHKLFGSTAEHLLKIAPCPVVTAGQDLLPR
jgi:nucleotide-binding universal stress UspA family protein